jgi:dipeptidyl-peptidase-4
MAALGDTFPRQYARTQRLTLGEPRNVVVSPDGLRVVFARSRDGSDPVNCLWVLDALTGVERLVADPVALLTGESGSPGDGGEITEDLPPEERARRERAREGASGVVGFATNTDVTVAAFALAGRLFACGLVSGAAREIPVEGPVFDPRPDPTARRLAYVSGPVLRIAELDGTSRVLAADDDPDVSWGSADFIAAEEMDRSRGYWWSPDGEAIAATRVDTSPVRRWFIGDPANPDREPTEIAYPAAGTDNALVTVHVLRLDGARVDVTWDRQALPYVADVRWISPDRLLLSVQSRDQRTVEVLEVDAETGRTTRRSHDSDIDWVELVPGVPAELPDGRLVTAADRDGARRLMVDGVPVTPADLQMRSVVRVHAGCVTFLANPLDDPTVQQVWQWRAAGVVADGSPEELTALTAEPGVHSAAVGGPGDRVVVVRRAALGVVGSTTAVIGGPTLANFAETPLVAPNVQILRVGPHRLATAVLLPTWADASTRLPVLMDPYGGPHAQRVIASNAAYLTSQWFADQGFAVVVVDGRGTPGRGSEWERAVRHDLASGVLDDQVEALQEAAIEFPQLDLTRVAIRGWSFGGYLAALAVLRRPDVFHAGIAGAPVTEWRLYDTHYTERYLGDPSVDPLPYDRSSLLTDAHLLERPLLIVHGLADDNVVAAHTLQLSSALLAAGRHHEVLPLSGVSHMTPQAVVAENLLLHQLAFLRSALGIAPPDGGQVRTGSPDYGQEREVSHP